MKLSMLNFSPCVLRDIFNNGGQIIKILEQLSAINKSLYCDLIKKITKFMCTLKSDSKLCEMTTSYYNTKC